MNVELSLTIRSSHAADIPIRISSLSTPQEALCLCSTHFRDNLSKCVYVHAGQLMNPFLSLAAQGVHDGDVIVVEGSSRLNRFTNDTSFPGQTLKERNYDEKIIEIFREFLRIQDTHFDQLDTNGRAYIIYGKLVRSQEKQQPATRTSIPVTHQISTEPLPILRPEGARANKGPNPYDLMPSFFFKSIEDAGKYFTQKASGSWNW